MKLIPINTPLIKKGDDIVNIFLNIAREKKINIKNGDIIAFADKIIAISEGRIINFNKIKSSEKAKSLAKKYMLEPGFVELVIREADEILGGVPRALLTIKNDIIIANAGLDHKNSPINYATLWPSNPNETAAQFRQKIEIKTNKKVGVILVDSHVAPMRMGTLGLALGIAGFKPVNDCRGMLDLYNKPLLVTRVNVADDIASAAHIIMCETIEKIPIVIIRNSNIEITDNYNPTEVIIPKEECLFMSNLSID